MIQRTAASPLQDLLRDYPAVALLGPRQCGKTTLARSLGGLYFDLENHADQIRLDATWPALMAGRQLIILDEAQCHPPVFPRIRSAIDADRARRGRFLLLGSVTPALMTHVSESLAGRLGIVELTPFLAPELPPGRTDELWLHGGFPDGGILEPARYPRWQLDYLQLLTQRDLPAWGLPARPQVTERLLRMLMAVHGQMWNASQLGQSLGLNHQTVSSYLDFLIGAFLIRRLEPFSANLHKRLIRTPRIYWRDTGVLHALYGIPSFDMLLVQPWVGASWEGFIIEQVLGHLAARGVHARPFFLRTSDGHELDLILEINTRRWAIEIKLTSDPAPADIHRLRKTAALINADRVVLLSRTPDETDTPEILSTNLHGLLRHLTRET